MLKISIITVCHNSRSTIAEALQSVAGQHYGAIEHIVIDGGSTDGTLAVLKQYLSGIACLISEPDSSIYDAMNKGIAKATGEIIGFLHSDDLYTDSSVLAEVAAAFSDPSVDACYGDLVYVHRKNPDKVVRYWRSNNADRKDLYLGWMPPHPTFFVRKQCYVRNGIYRTDLGSSADYELMLRYLLKERIYAVYLPRVLVRMRVGGMSNASLRQRMHAHLMDWKAWQVNGLIPCPWTLPMKPLRKLHQWIFRKYEV
jgi:glycosyltransferase